MRSTVRIRLFALSFGPTITADLDFCTGLLARPWLCISPGIESRSSSKVNAKLCVYNFGWESWTLRKNEETRLDAFEMKGLRKMLRVSWTAKKTNEWVLKQARKMTRSLDGQHQDVDRTPRGSQSEWQRTGINRESTSMVWPTLGSRTAEEQNRTHGQCNAWPTVTFPTADRCPWCRFSFSVVSVHVLMLSIQAVRGLPRLRAPGIVPCIISFSTQLPCFLTAWP